MGLINWTAAKPGRELRRLPSGCFTTDALGEIVASTLPQAFPRDHLRQIAFWVKEAFRQVHEARLSVQELRIEYTALTLTAREVRGGAIIFLSPRAAIQN